MHLRNQLIVLTVLTFLAVLAVLFISLNTIMMDGYNKIEQQNVLVDLERAEDSINTKNRELDRIASDWAAWDDTYRFMGDHNRAFIESSLPDKAVANLDVNFLLFLDTSGHIFHAKAVDIDNSREVGLPAGLMDRLTPSSRLLQFKQLTDGNLAIVMQDNKPLLLAARQVITSNFSGPPRGYLVVGRFIDATLLKKLVEVTHLNIRLHPIPENFSPSNHKRVSYQSQETIAGETIMRDMDRKPISLIRIDIPRTIYQQGLKTSRTTSIALAACGFVFLSVLLIFGEFSIVKHLEKMGRKAEEIASNPINNERMQLCGGAELQQLGKSINVMLDSLDASARLIRDNEVKFRTVLHQSGDAIFMFDPHSRMILEANPAFYSLTGYTIDELPELSMDTISVDLDVLGSDIEAVLSKGAVRIADQKFRLKNGEIIEIEAAANAITINSKTVINLVARDVTERNREHRQINEMAVTDMLTGIPNRRHLMQRGVQEFERIRRARQKGDNNASLCCIMIDIDHFKLINDESGHQCGDEVLRQCATRLACCLRPYDIIGRYGGEEFVVFLVDTTPEQSRVVAERMWGAVRNSGFTFEEVTRSVTVSLGISNMTMTDTLLDDLIKRADTMLYAAKNRGRDRIEET